MKYIHNKDDTITRVYENKELEHIIEIAAEIIYHAANKRCPVKCSKYMDKIIDPVVSGDICMSKCPDDKIICWENYLYCAWYHYYFNGEEGDEE